jgi:2-polyprenyl-3-methyl-5-hydroxy-6-metoxy-1,4-benzoquinol methylase
MGAVTNSARPPLRTATVWHSFRKALDGLMATSDRPGLAVADVGGGTGGFAVPLAELGHRVTVVDPSPNALATLERRAKDAGVEDRVLARQGEAASLAAIVGSEQVDVVVCHGVLEVVDDPAAAVAGLHAALRPGGLASVLVAQRHGAVLARAVAGHLTDALHVLRSAAGQWPVSDPLGRRFDNDEIVALLAAAGFTIESVHGARVFTDLVPGETIDEPSRARDLLELETAAAEVPALRAIAGQLHVLAMR